MNGIETIYVAGKMRGLPGYNWPAFDAARECLRSQGFKVISPADLDRRQGFDNRTPEEDLTIDAVRQLFGNSVWHLINEADAVALLPGWKKSRGTQAEICCAKAIDLPLFEYDEGTLWPFVEDQADDDILAEAIQITSFDRQSQYGSPNKDFMKIAAMWTAIFEREFKPTDVALALLCLKISRLSHAVKADSLRDVAGYARCAYQIFLEEERNRLGGSVKFRRTA